MTHMRREDCVKIRSVARTVAQNEIRAHKAEGKAEGRPEAAAPYTGAIKRLGELGLLGLTTPPTFGGHQSDARAYSALIEEIARACPSTAALILTHLASVLPLARAGSNEQRKLLLPKLASGEALMGFSAINAEADGFTAEADDVVAVKRGDEWVLDGIKRHVTGAFFFNHFLVLARSGRPDAETYTLFWLRDGDTGLSRGRAEHRVGLDGARPGELVFRDCRIPADRVVGAPGNGAELARPFLPYALIGESALALGIVQELLRVCRAYANDRILAMPRQSAIDGPAKAIATFETEVAAMALMQETIAYQYDEKEGDEAIPSYQLKAYSAQAMIRTGRLATEMVANRVDAPRNAVERLLAHLRALNIYYVGGDAALKRLAAAFVTQVTAQVTQN